ncbi:hypothetical protein SFLOR_v1c09860 [Spiroplasma floricola 23-6]|uniref:Uncharacterized protein n=1 Tax=Spiroplasma floricola 23-6 TaxID=1336749 RepID=A0A2K8SF17_9MOLU|nr:hypothetical protein SFLOR_v1c09860 [Spiroplasma floricola 23-6]
MCQKCKFKNKELISYYLNNELIKVCHNCYKNIRRGD